MIASMTKPIKTPTKKSATARAASVVKAELAKRGMTAADLSRAANVNQMVLSRLVRGTRLPSAHALARIAKVFSVSVDSLLDTEKPNG